MDSWDIFFDITSPAYTCCVCKWSKVRFLWYVCTCNSAPRSIDLNYFSIMTMGKSPFSIVVYFSARYSSCVSFLPTTSFQEADCAELVPDTSSKYTKKTYTQNHVQVGGVTVSAWHILHWIRMTMTTQACWPLLMTMNVYPWTLQITLYDTKSGRLHE